VADVPAPAKSLIAKLAADPDHGKFAYLDPSDADHRDTIRHFLERAGKGEERYPALHADVSAGRAEQPNEAPDHCLLVDAGRAESGVATARTWVSSRGGAYLSGAHTLLLDGDSGETLASGAHTQVGRALVQDATDAAQAKPAGAKLTAVSFFHTQQTPDSPPRFGLAASSRAVVDAADTTPSVTLPVSKLYPTYIQIGLWRGAVQTDCDYSYVGGGGTGPAPDRVAVPFGGSIALPWSITGAPTLNTQLYATAYGAVVHDPTQNLSDPARIQVDGSTIKWDYPADQQALEITNSVRYTAPANLSMGYLAFFFSFSVPVATTPSTYPFAVCTTDYNQPYSGFCFPLIVPIQFVWHCIEADAEITLADGSRQTIRELDNTVAVRRAAGDGQADVRATSRSYHDDLGGQDPLLRLVTMGGRSLILSSRHPVHTPGGAVTAGELAAGDDVVVEDGTDQVASCDRAEYGDYLCNLELAGDGGAAYEAFFANGIAVGDLHAERDAYEARRLDTEYMLARLPETHHQDFLSAIEDIRAS
jgi:hypothetical protein